MRRHIVLFVFLLAFFCLPVATVYAQTNPLRTGAKAIVYMMTPPQSEDVDYPLPFPGILTTHPLYLFKQLRDSLMEAFINDPYKKIEFSLLQSDKFLAMSLKFAEMKDWTNAWNTMKKSQAMMEETVTHAVSITGSGNIIPDTMMERLEKSTVKHKEIADDLQTQAQKQEKSLFQGASDRFASLAATITALR